MVKLAIVNHLFRIISLFFYRSTTDFWRTVWQRKTDVILMLCRVEEKNARGRMVDKSAQYYPTGVSRDFVSFHLSQS